MTTERLQTERLLLVRQTVDEVRAVIAAMTPDDLAEVSPDWLARLNRVGGVNPWMLGFRVTEQASGKGVGHCVFKGPPGPGRVVEIAYSTEPEYRGRGYATEAVRAVVAEAFRSEEVEVVRAHTLLNPNASATVLQRCGFVCLGEVTEPEDGLVWRWERARSRASGEHESNADLR